jgi:hypothetical protein
VGRDEALGVDLDHGAPPLYASRCAERVEVSLAQKEELQEADAPVAARVTEAEQHQVVGQPGFLHDPDGVFAVVGEAFYGVLGAVVVPGYAIMLDEGEQLVPILQ